MKDDHKTKKLTKNDQLISNRQKMIYLLIKIYRLRRELKSLLTQVNKESKSLQKQIEEVRRQIIN